MVLHKHQSIEHARGWALECSLHLHQEGFEDLACRSFKQISRLVQDSLRNPCASEELRGFLRKVVAVVFDDVVLFSRELGPDVLQEILEDFLGDLGVAQFHFLDGLAEGSLLGGVPADAPSEVVFLPEDDDGGVVDGVDLLADQHHAHGAGHPLGDVVQREDYLFRHVI